MNTLVWLLLGVAGLVAVHMGILIYLYRSTADSGTRSAETVGAPESAGTDEGDRERPRSDGTDRTACPACGAPNDPTYRFCRRCISDLSAGKTTPSGDGPTERLGS